MQCSEINHCSSLELERRVVKSGCGDSVRESAVQELTVILASR